MVSHKNLNLLRLILEDYQYLCYNGPERLGSRVTIEDKESAFKKELTSDGIDKLLFLIDNEIGS